MTKKMLIDATHDEETRVAVVDGRKLVEFDYESKFRKPLKGSIFLAKVTRVEPSLQAAFVNFGGNRHGFLPFSEIHPDYFRIPIADREALLAEQQAMIEEQEAAEREREQREAEEEQQGGERGGETAGEDGTPEGEDNVEYLDHGDDAVEEIGGGNDAKAESPAAGGPLPDERSGNEAADEEPRDNMDANEGADDRESDSENDPGNDREQAGDNAHGAMGDEGDDFTAPGNEQDAEGQEQDGEGEGRGQDEQGDREGRGRGRFRRGRRNSGRGGGRGRHRMAYRSNRTEKFGGEDYSPEERFRFSLRRKYKIQEVIKRGQIMLVQVSKEERGNKGAAVSTYLSLPGRYCVLMPNSPRAGGVSRKIANYQDRARMKEIMQEIQVPQGMSVIVRTAGVSRTKPEIKRDLDYLMRLWDNIRELTLQSSAPSKVYEEADLIKRAVRDLYGKDIEEIVVAGDEGHKTAKNFMKMMIPSHVKNVIEHTSEVPLFTEYRVEEQIAEIGEARVQLPSGGYLIINQTEALVAVDVNSGKATKERHIEETALKTNMEAASEIARQLRLRDLGGLIVIDFIDMEDRRNNSKVERRVREALSTDRARIQMSRISSFGLMELSRQRLNPSLTESQFEVCQHCAGMGRIRTADAMAIMVLRAIEAEGIKGRPGQQVIAHVSNDVAVYILNNKRKNVSQIEGRYNMSILIRVDETLGASSFRIEVLKKPGLADDEDAPEIKEVHMHDHDHGHDDGDDELQESGESEAQDRGPDRNERGERTERSGERGDDRGEERGGRRRGRRGGRGRNQRGGRREWRDRDDRSNDRNDNGRNTGGGFNGDRDEEAAGNMAPSQSFDDQSFEDDEFQDAAAHQAIHDQIVGERESGRPHAGRERGGREGGRERGNNDRGGERGGRGNRGGRGRGGRSRGGYGRDRNDNRGNSGGDNRNDSRGDSRPQRESQGNNPDGNRGNEDNIGNFKSQDAPPPRTPSPEPVAARPQQSEAKPAEQRVRDYETVNPEPSEKKRGWWNRLTE